MALFLAALAVALGVSFICSLAEATLLSLTPSQVAQIAQSRADLGGLWRRFKAEIQGPIATILLLNTTAHTIGAAVAGAQFHKLFGQEWLWCFSLVFTYAMLQFTEVLPKTLGVRFNRELAVVIGRPLHVIAWMLRPVLGLIHWVNRPFEAASAPGRVPATIEEITVLAGLARLANQIGPQQERIIVTATRLADLRARDVMLPTEQIAFLSTSQTLADALLTAHIDAHTRYPVCEQGDPDRVVGYVNFKELVYYMRTNPNDWRLQGVIRPIHFVSPEESAADLLRTFVSQHIHIAIVRDSSGKTLGLVTLEDLIEELVGELEDEFDRLPRMFHPLSGGTWMIGGGLPVKELAARLDVALGDAQGTVSAWLTRRLGRNPRVGDEYVEAGVKFAVRRVRRGQVFEAVASRLPL